MGQFSGLQGMGLQFCGTPTGLLFCIIKCICCWPCSTWCCFLGHRTLVQALCDLWGKKGSLHHIFHMSGTSMWESESICALCLKQITCDFSFFKIVYSPQLSLCYGTKSTLLIFSLASGTSSINRTIPAGKLQPGANSQKCCSIEYSYFWNLKTAWLLVLCCCKQVISITENLVKRQKMHDYLMLSVWDSGKFYIACGKLLLFIMRTAEVKWNTKRLYCLN